MLMTTIAAGCTEDLQRQIDDLKKALAIQQCQIADLKETLTSEINERMKSEANLFEEVGPSSGLNDLSTEVGIGKKIPKPKVFFTATR